MRHLYHVRRLTWLVLALLLSASVAFAQPGVGIGTTAPDASAALEVVSSSKGALLPRLTQAARLAMGTGSTPPPAPGLLVYQTDGAAGFYYNAGSAPAPDWQQIATANGAAITAGNGLTRMGTSIGLGGALSQPTAVVLGANSLALTGGIGPVQQISQLAGNVNTGSGTAPGLGQSFTLPANATITQVQVYSVSGGSGTLTLYQGAPGGPVLGTPQAVTYNTGGATTIVLTTPVVASAAGTYSFSTGANAGSFALGSGNPYAGGTAYDGTTPITFSFDMKFVVRYTALTTPFYASSDGRVGIGTDSPTTPLDVAGAVRLRDLPTAGVVTTDGSGNLSSGNYLGAAGSGLTQNGPIVALGGALTQPTALTLGSQSLTLFGTSGPAQQVSQLVANTSASSSSGPGLGQSFTLPAGVTITQVDVYNNTGGFGTLTLYQGAPGGAVLGTPQFVFYGSGAFSQIVLTTPVVVTTAGTYSFSTGGNSGTFSFSSGNLYSGGSAYDGTTALSPAFDLKFAVHYAATSAVFSAANAGVGIGTAAPGATLDVAGTASTVRLQGLSGSGSRVVTAAPDGTLGTSDGGTSFIQNQAAADQPGGFRVSGDGLVAGRVGIGTTAPAQRLEVAGTISPTTIGTEALVRLTRPDNAGVKYPNTAELRLGTYADATTTNTSASRLDLALGNGGTSAPEVTVLSVLGNGRIGIGTTTPRGRFDMDGGGDTYLVDNPNNGTQQSVYLPGHLFLAPYSGSGGTAYVQARALNPTASTSIGLTLRTTSSGNLIDALTINPNGSAVFAGSVTATSFSPSDQRLKENIRPLRGALAAVQALRGVRYRYRQEVPNHPLPPGEQVGVLAQEVEQLYPELVTTGPDGYKAVNYAQLAPVLIEAIKELKAENDELKRQATQTSATLESLADRLRALEASAGQAH